MSKKLTLKHCHELAKSRNGKCLSEVYMGNKSVLTWECSKSHKWPAKYNDIQQGKWCPECVGLKKKTLLDCNVLASSHDGKCLSAKYINSKSKLTWECKEKHKWKTSYNSVHRGTWCPRCCIKKRKETCIERYGVDNPTKNREIALRASRSSNGSKIVLHWLTKEELVCVASYEIVTVEHFNKNKINFKWQPKTFITSLLTPKGAYASYRPDVYLPDEDKWVEIKGYFRKDSEQKWEWFHKEYPNSELWDRKRLKEMEILQ